MGFLLQCSFIGRHLVPPTQREKRLREMEEGAAIVAVLFDGGDIGRYEPLPTRGTSTYLDARKF
jgi:hypothetical protein